MTHIHTTGEGPRVLLIQGTGIAGQAWRPQIEALASDYTLAWYDAKGINGRAGTPGSVADMAADAQNILNDLGWDRAFVIGHSLGGVIAQRLALDAPDRVAGLLLVCTFAQGRAALSLNPTTMWIQTRTSLGTAAMRRRAFYALVSHPDIAPTEDNITQLEAAFGRALHDQPPAVFAQVWALVRADLSSQLHTIACPAAVISGTHDRVAPPRQGRRLADALGCDLELLDGAHALPIQHARVLNDRLIARLSAWTAATSPHA